MRAYTADMIPGGASPVINVSQYDNDYAVTVTLIEGAEIYTPPSGATIMVEGTKPDGNGFSYACTYQGNVVTVPIYTQMTAVAGRFPIELVVYQSGLRVGSCNITLAVERAPLDDDEIISDSDIPAIISLAQSQADAAASSAASAETAKTAAMDAAEDAIDAAQELQTAIQFNAALIHETASGAVASFADGADNIPMQSVVAEITPVQSGSGDPSPTNIRPISGRTGLTVTRSGKNLLKNTAETITEYGVTFTCNEDGTVSTSGTSTKNANYLLLGIQTLAAGTYVFSGCPSGGGATVYYQRANRGSTPSGSSAVMLASDYGDGGTFTLTEPTEIVTYIACDSGKNMDGLVFRPMIRLASDTDTYEAPQNTEIQITWESSAGTVYGGTLDVVSGVLTVDKYYLTLADTSTPTVGGYSYQQNPNRWQVSLSDDLMPSNDTMAQSICDTFAYWDGAFSGWPDSTFRFSAIQSGGHRFLQFKWEGQPTTGAELRALLAENPIHFVIPLATPQTYQLTPTEVRTLLGGNTIYTDAGDVTVEYIADTKMYIDNKIAALQALVLEN